MYNSVYNKRMCYKWTEEMPAVPGADSWKLTDDVCGLAGLTKDVTEGFFGKVGYNNINAWAFTENADGSVVGVVQQTAFAHADPTKVSKVFSGKVTWMFGANGKIDTVLIYSQSTIQSLFMSANEVTVMTIVDDFFAGKYLDNYDQYVNRQNTYTWSHVLPNVPGFKQTYTGTGLCPFPTVMCAVSTAVWYQCMPMYPLHLLDHTCTVFNLAGTRMSPCENATVCAQLCTSALAILVMMCA